MIVKMMMMIMMMMMITMKMTMVVMLLMMVAITSRLASIQAELSDNQGRGFSRACEGLVFRFFVSEFYPILPNFYIQVLPNFDSFAIHSLTNVDETCLM